MKTRLIQEIPHLHINLFDQFYRLGKEQKLILEAQFYTKSISKRRSVLKSGGGC